MSYNVWIWAIRAVSNESITIMKSNRYCIIFFYFYFRFPIPIGIHLTLTLFSCKRFRNNLSILEKHKSKLRKSNTDFNIETFRNVTLHSWVAFNVFFFFFIDARVHYKL